MGKGFGGRVSIMDELRHIDSFDLFVSTLLQKVCGTMQWEFGAQWALAGEGAFMSLSKYWVSDSLKETEFMKDTKTRTYTPGDGMVGETWRTGRIRLSTNTAADMRLPRGIFAYTYGLPRGVWIPLLGPEGISVLEFLFSRPNSPSEEELDTLKGICALACKFPVAVVPKGS